MKTIWLPVATVVIAAAIMVWVWWFGDAQRQWNVFFTMGTLLVSTGLLFMWLVCFSGWSRRVRLSIFGLVVVGFGLFLVLFRVSGVSGDFIPILTWRFAPTVHGQLQTDMLTLGTADVAIQLESSHRDSPQFLGPTRDGVLKGVRLAADWQKNPPRLLWRQPIGAGWSGFAVVGQRALTQEQRGDLEMVTCYDLLTGRLLWMHSDDVRFEDVVSGTGPRSTPTVTGNRVYTFGATGILNCLDRDTGETLWRRDVVVAHDARVNEWGTSVSPLVHSQLVIVAVSAKSRRALVAYDKDSGDPVWTAGNDKSAYSSPALTTFAGVQQFIILNHESVAAHDTETGAMLWSAAWPGKYPKVAQPVVLSGDRVVVSSGYGVGCALFQVRRSAGESWNVELVWKTRSLKAKFANFVHRDGFLYGLDDGILACVDVESGKRRWKRARYGHGQLILTDNLLLVLSEFGFVALTEPTPEEHREVARLPIFERKTWNPPVLATPYLLVRNDEEAACYELPLAD